MANYSTTYFPKDNLGRPLPKMEFSEPISSAKIKTINNPPTMKIEIAKFQDGYYYVVDGVKQSKVGQEVQQLFPNVFCGMQVLSDPELPKNTMQLRTRNHSSKLVGLDNSGSYTKNPVPNVPIAVISSNFGSGKQDNTVNYIKKRLNNIGYFDIS